MLILHTATKKVESALAFYRGLKVYPAPGDLIKIYDSTVPKVRGHISPRTFDLETNRSYTAHIRYPRRDDRLRLGPGHPRARAQRRHQPRRHPQRRPRLRQQPEESSPQRQYEPGGPQKKTSQQSALHTNSELEILYGGPTHHLPQCTIFCVNNVTLNEPAAALGKGNLLAVFRNTSDYYYQLFQGFKSTQALWRLLGWSSHRTGEQLQ